MYRFVIRGSRRAASALIFALTVTFLANCLYAAGATPEEQACCAAMDHDCSAMAQEHSCCTSEASAVQTGPVAKRLVTSAPPSILVALLASAEPLVYQSVWDGAAGAAVKPPGVSIHLLDSTFRI